MRAERLGALTEQTATLVVEVDGDASAFALRLVALGVAAHHERQRVLVQLPAAGDETAMRHAYDAVRDTAVAESVGVLKMERRRGRLEDLFR